MQSNMQLSDDEIEFMLQIGYLFIQIERWEDGLALTRFILDVQPENIDALRLSAYGLLYCGKYQAAIEICDFTMKITQDPKVLEPILKIKKLAISKKIYHQKHQDSRKPKQKRIRNRKPKE